MDFVALGELLIDMFPAEVGRRFNEVSAFIPKPGGAPANVAVAGARLGAQTAFIGKVGQDFFGHFLEEVLQKENVDTRGLRYDLDARTTLALIAQPSPQHNEYIFYRNPGADQRLRPDELDVALLTSTRALHIGSLSLSDEPSRSATLEAVRVARHGGAMISFDVNFRPALWRSNQDALTQIAAMLPMADVVKVNEIELELLTNTADVETGSAAILARGPKLVVVTLGAAGSYFRTARSSGYAKAFQVETIDATGCGDSFVGALLAQLVQFGAEEIDAHIQEALRFANAAGAITSTRHGAMPALPTLREVHEFLAAHPASDVSSDVTEI
jgi:fructokinase